jgi:hypothetical protein
VTAVKVLPEKTRAEKFPIKLNGCPLIVASNSVTAAAPAPYVAPGVNPVIPNVPVPIISEGDSSNVSEKSVTMAALAGAAATIPRTLASKTTADSDLNIDLIPN